MSMPISKVYGSAPGTEFTASQIAETNVAKRTYEKEYMDYWNSTASLTGTGRPVDAVVAPLAPFAAARPAMYDYYSTYILCRVDLLTFILSLRVMPGYTVIVNMLDYTATTIPVTTVDKNIDIVDKEFKPLNEQDEAISKICEFIRFKLWRTWHKVQIC